MIPPLIHITCRDKQHLGRHAPFVETIAAKHPHWHITLYDDDDIQQFVQQSFPFLRTVFSAYQTDVQRTDLFRLLVVLKKGGFYLDADMHCLKSLDDLRTYPLVLGEEKTLTTAVCIDLKHAHPLRIANYLFGGVAGHPFLQRAVCAAITSVNRPVRSEEDVLESTGPGMLTTLFHQCPAETADGHLVENRTNWCEKQCSDGPSCHFGDYAIHAHLGSWRWDYHRKIRRLRPAPPKPIPAEALSWACALVQLRYAAVSSSALTQHV